MIGLASLWRRKARKHSQSITVPAGFSAWHGPIALRPSLSAPILSWFVSSIDRSPLDALIRSLDTMFHSEPRLGESEHVKALMSRVLESDALHLRQRFDQLPELLTLAGKSNNVLVIDERLRSEIDPDTSAHDRIGHFDALVQHLAVSHPGSQIWMLRSNDPGHGRWFSDRIEAPRNAHRLTDASSLRDILRHVASVYTVTASEGMAALLAGIPVHVFGRPYYAGWGLTHDAQPLSDRQARPTIASLFEAVFIRSTHCVDIETYAVGTLDALLDMVDLQHAIARRFADLQRVTGVCFQWWKRPFATPYLLAGGGRLRWRARLDATDIEEHAALWGARPANTLPPHVPHVRMEDGFIHSAGLGSDMCAPRSQVIDRLGLYFDANTPSELSILLNTAEFPPEELARAAALRHRIVTTGITKYNLGRKPPEWRAPTDRKIALVAGQVADDASIRLGTRGIDSVDTLLCRVRERRPDAFIVYKPHPDVLSGNRNGLVDAAHLADVVDSESDMISLIEVADEVHTLSSLAGFDALLRGKTVCTYGLPFYAGWGLTDDDLAPLPRRDRTLTLEMLVAGALLRYPLYWDWHLQIFTTPEAVVHQLSGAAARPLRTVAQDRRRPSMKAFRWIRNVLRHLFWRYRQISVRRDTA